MRERLDDIPLLVDHFRKELNQRHGKNVTSVSDPLRKAMIQYEWPGNVRELRNLIESMIVQDKDGVLDLDDLQDGDSLRRLATFPNSSLGMSAGAAPEGLVGRPLTEVERFYIERTLEMTHGNREEAARLLGIGARTLYRKIKEWAVKKDEG